jgi:hypothetical protein
MLKEVIENEENHDFDEKGQKYGYITMVSLESVENVTVLAALTFIDISGAMIGVVMYVAGFTLLRLLHCFLNHNMSYTRTY